MAYIKVTGGTPEPYTIRQLRRDNPNTSFPRRIPEETLSHYGVFSVKTLDRPTVADWQTVEKSAAARQQSDGSWAYEWETRNKTQDELDRDAGKKRDQIKNRRNAAINSGTVVDGVALATDNLTQQRVAALALAAQIDSGPTVNWKLPSGTFVPLSAEQVIRFAQHVQKHVQACFNREAELLRLLDAGEEYDIDKGWPS